MAPLGAFVLAFATVPRTRRGAGNLAMFGAFVMLLATLLVAWGLTRKSGTFLATYPYFNLAVAFSGPVNFQTFAIDIGLHVDHLTVMALLVIEVCAIGSLGWHQVMGRSEPGAARFNAEVSALLFACAGVVVSQDLAELLAFWGVAGVMTYLMLAHRWGQDDAARRGRVALALPFATDMSLLCGIAWLYARYGLQNLTTLVPILHTNPGWTVRSLVVAAILLFVGFAGRLALWPLGSWVTQTAVTAPPAASALAQSVWSVLAIVVLFRAAPIIAASNPQTLQILTYAAAGTAVVGAVLGLLSNEPRGAISLVGSAVAAVGAAVVLLSYQGKGAGFAVAGVACVLASAPARAAAVLAASAISGAMRTDDLAEMGGAWRRMRASSGALLLSTIVIGVSAFGALVLGVTSRSVLGVVLGEAVLLISVASLRVFLVASIGPLRRRRAFEPERVREAAPGSLGWPYWLSLAGAVLFAASLTRGWLDFLDGQKHHNASTGALELWAAVAVIGFLAAAFAYARNKDGALRFSAAAGGWLSVAADAGAALVDRFLIGPLTDLARRLGEWLPAGDGAVGRFTGRSGELAAAGARVPAAPVVVVLVVLAAAGLALLAQGVLR